MLVALMHALGPYATYERNAGHLSKGTPQTRGAEAPAIMLCAGVIVGGAVPAMACALTWTRCTRLAAIISATLAPSASKFKGLGLEIRFW